MRDDTVVLIAEDDEGHAVLIMKNLARAGISNQMLHFKDGQEILDYLTKQNNGSSMHPGGSYVLLLDIRMPKLDGIEVLKRTKGDAELSKIPVIIVTTTDNPKDVERCHALGCEKYITKPVDYENFVGAIRQLGNYLLNLDVPLVN